MSVFFLEMSAFELEMSCSHPGRHTNVFLFQADKVSAHSRSLLQVQGNLGSLHVGNTSTTYFREEHAEE